MIEVKNVVKSYNGKVVVDNISLQVEEGTITSFIGPNGAGKSTLISMISRIIDKDSGEIYIDGVEVSDWDSKELAKKISILKQSNHIDLKLTIRELVNFGRFPYSQGSLTDEDKKYVDMAIDYMKLRDIEDKYIDELSGGQRQRAYIAMVIAQNTDYILLDEPLNNLDMKHSVEIMKILRNLVKELGKTVIIVIHDINFASCYSDFIVALKDGKLAKEGTTNHMICRKVLGDIYDLDFQVKSVDERKICVYY